MLTLLVLLNYLVASLAIIVSLHVLRRTGWRSVIAVMTLLFALLHMVGVYWVPDEIVLYTPFDENAFNTMLVFHIMSALILVSGCLLQSQGSTLRVRRANESVALIAAVFLFSMTLTALPVAVFMTGAFLLLGFPSRSRADEARRQSAHGEVMTAIIRFPLSLIAIVLFAGFLAYVLISTGVLNSVQMTLQYGFGSLPEYIGLRVRNGLIPSFWTSQLDAIKTSIAPAVSLFLLSAFLCKRKWILLPLLAALNILVILAGLEYFAKSPLAVYAIQVAITYAAGVATKRVPAGRKLTFLAGFRLFAGVVLSTAILAWMYSFTRFSDNLTDTVVQISRRIFLTPSQSAYTWFYVFPARMDSIGFSQSHILSSIFGVRYSVTGYLPYTVSVLATGNMFGLNANFMATAWAYFGAWGLIVTVQLVVGTIFVERWLQSVSDPYVYWPVYAFVYGSLIIAVTVPFDGAVMFYGVWLVPVLFCLLAKAFASRVHDSRSASQLQAVKALNELVESNAR